MAASVSREVAGERIEPQLQTWRQLTSIPATWPLLKWESVRPALTSCTRSPMRHAGESVRARELPHNKIAITANITLDIVKIIAK